MHLSSASPWPSLSQVCRTLRPGPEGIGPRRHTPGCQSPPQPGHSSPKPCRRPVLIVAQVACSSVVNIQNSEGQKQVLPVSALCQVGAGGRRVKDVPSPPFLVGAGVYYFTNT
ncbi:hypothetical protein E2C01_036881 [Portunus trituberculatus]|uniref:Uncharacterized protein n=1 Tax=Portunus trituberculatus TaxID=210409 RepID=A0A5B7F6M6_PORTR|nr:hypothetical protein [Portunus trituberculatus]